MYLCCIPYVTKPVCHCFVNVVAASHMDMSPEVVEFKNIGCGQYMSSITVAVELNSYDTVIVGSDRSFIALFKKLDDLQL